MRTITRLLCLLAAAVLVAACGLPRDDEPRALPEGALDEQVAGPRTTNPPTSQPSAPTTQQTVYLVTGNSPERLIRASVPVEQPSNPVLLPRLVIEALVRTRPADVALAGIANNQLPSDVAVLDATVQPDGVLDLNLSSLGIQGPNLRLAMAQLVYTATEIPGVAGVRVSLDGRSVAVPTEQGTADTNTVITRADYASLDPSNAGTE